MANGAGKTCNPITNSAAYISSGMQKDLVNKRLLQARHEIGGLSVPGAGGLRSNLFVRSAAGERGDDWDRDNG
jgi:hypothetical protein